MFSYSGWKRYGGIGAGVGVDIRHRLAREMNQHATSTLFAVGLLLGMSLLLEAGRRVGQRRMDWDTEGSRAELQTEDEVHGGGQD